MNRRTVGAILMALGLMLCCAVPNQLFSLQAAVPVGGTALFWFGSTLSESRVSSRVLMRRVELGSALVVAVAATVLSWHIATVLVAVALVGGLVLIWLHADRRQSHQPRQRPGLASS